jgi:hypothetical protein
MKHSAITNPQEEQKMEKLDLKKNLKYLYATPAGKVVLVDVPAFNFLKIDGVIEPGCRPGDSPAFTEAIGALYGAAYTLKFMIKKRPVDPVDYPVMALEALWWTKDEGVNYDFNDPTGWHWTAMILQPDVITPELYAEAVAQLVKKKGTNPSIEKMRLEPFREGLSVQILHIGPYATEPESVAKMDLFAEQNGYRMYGRHHEIYLGDPMRADPAKLKTILRHPVEKG